MKTLSQVLDKQIRDLRREFERTLAMKTQINTVLLPCESLPIIAQATQTSEGSIRVWEPWGDQVTPGVMVSLYYKTTSIPAILPVLEYLEHAYSAEFKSHDRADGVRVFSLAAPEFNFDLNLYVSPDTENTETECRRILVGEDTETRTTKTPRYAISCKGAAS